MNQVIKKVYKDDLCRNSTYLILNNVVMTGFGFIFWMICARIFTATEVGLATTIISAVGLVASFSYLGLNIGLIRYYPKTKDKGKLIGSCLNLTAITSIIASFIFIALIPTLNPKLIFIITSPILFSMFISFSLFWVLFTIINSIFIAKKKSAVVLAKSVIFSLGKIMLPFFFIFLGAFGILMSYYIPALIAFFFAFFFFRYRFTIDIVLIKKMFKFSAGNYVASVLGMMPALILPLIITNRLSPESTAFFYVSWMMAGLLFFVPQAISQTLLSEGSHDSNGLKKKVNKSLLFSALLLIPGIFIILFMGKDLLYIFGPEYSINGTRLLQILAIGSIFYGLNQIKIMRFNILHQIRKTIFMQFVITSIIITGSLLVPTTNLYYYGIVFLTGHIVGGIFL